jgi:hypothetical protein
MLGSGFGFFHGDGLLGAAGFDCPLKRGTDF